MEDFKLMRAPRISVCIAINKPVNVIGKLVGKFDAVYVAFDKSHIEQARELAKSGLLPKVSGSFILDGCSHDKITKDITSIHPHDSIWVMGCVTKQ